MNRRASTMSIWTLPLLVLLAQPLAAQVIDRSRAVRTRLPKPEITLLAQQWAQSDIMDETWVRNYTETAPTEVRFRWSTTLQNVTGARWQVSKSHDDFSAPIRQGFVTVPPPGQSADFHVDFRKIPGSSELPQTYWVRVVTGPSQQAVSPVRINFVEQEPTKFTAEGLYPELFRPMPIYVSMHNFEIVRADEEDDEEPYIMPVVVYLDGTTIDVLDRPNSTVRVQTSARYDTHGNIPQYNSSIGSGDRIAVPDDVGYFETTILPLNLNLADKNLFGFEVDWTHLVGATTVWVGVLAMEQDRTLDDAVNSARDAFVQGLKAELENCLREMTFDQVLRLVKEGQNVNAVLTRDEASACGYTASEEEGTVLDQIRAKLRDLSEDAGKAEELDEAKNWLPGGGLFLLHQLANPDDVVGFDFRVFTYEQIMNASGPIKFTLDFDKNAPASGLSAGRKTIHYKLEVNLGRCLDDPTKSRCTPTYEPLLN